MTETTVDVTLTPTMIAEAVERLDAGMRFTDTSRPGYPAALADIWVLLTAYRALTAERDRLAREREALIDRVVQQQQRIQGGPSLTRDDLSWPELTGPTDERD